MLRVVLSVLILSSVLAAADEYFIVELTGEPAIKSRDPKRVRRSALGERRRQVRAAQRSAREAIINEGAQVVDSVDTVANALIVRSAAERAGRLGRLRGVARVHKIREYKLVLDRAVLLNHVSDAWPQVGGIGKAGAGIKIGIIDTGIEISHPAFQDADLPEVDGFPKVNRDTDLQYTNRKVIVARSYDRNALAGSARDREGHGTGVAMIAAGRSNSGPYGSITGIAPKAYIGNYKVFPDGRSTAPTDLILRALDDAVADGMDVINLSLGSVFAERPDRDILVEAVERATAAGVIVVVAAGNEGPHLNTIGSPATAPSAISVGNSYSDRIFAARAIAGDSLYLMIPGSGPNAIRSVTATITDVGAIDQSGLACDALPPGSLDGAIALILRGACTFEVKINNAQLAGAAAALVYTHSESPQASGMSVGAATAIPSGMISHADGLDLKARLEGGLNVTLQFDASPLSVDSSRLNDSSSRGPSAGLGIKPELVAVGTSIYTAGLGSLSLPGYRVASGTSFSSPVVAGAAAVLKSQRPGLSVEQYRSLLVHSAGVFPEYGAFPVQQAGTGQLNLAAALQSPTALSPVSLSFGASEGQFDTSETLTLMNLGQTSDSFSIGVTPLAGDASPALSAYTLQVEPGGTAELTVQLQAQGLSAGTYEGFITVWGNQSGIESRVPYWFAVPSNLPGAITILDAPESGSGLSRHSIVFRTTDSSGLPVSIEPAVTVVKGDGRVVSVSSIDAEIPGAWVAEVRLGTENGSNEYQIQVGDARTTVTITGQ